MDESTQNACYALAMDMADAARTATLRHFRQTGLQSDNKDHAGFDPVTEGDRSAERAMRALIEAQRPMDGILGEEFGQTASRSGLTWVLDPIDGTRGFVSGTPTWGVLIALHDGARPIFGVIDQPYIGERFIGGFGRAEMTGPLGGRDLEASKITTLSEATIFTTFPELGTEAEAQAFQRVATQCKLTRYGMDCYAYGLLAAGHVDLVIEAGLQAYDIQAPIAVIEAAGGMVTNWDGGAADQGGQVIAAATPQLYDAALALLHAQP